MKKILEILFIFSLGVFILTSCEQDINEYTLKDLGAAATTPSAVVIDTVAETFCTFIITPAQIEGRTYYMVLNEGEATPDVYAVIAGSADVVASGYFAPTALENDTVTISDLDMVSSYDIYTFAVSEAGVASTYSAAANLKTLDVTIAFTFGITEINRDGKIVLKFDTDISYVEGKKITFVDAYGYQADQVINSADGILVEGNIVTVIHDDFWSWSTVEMTIEAGAFVDAYDNVTSQFVADIDISFDVAQYTGTYQLISDDGYGPYTDTIDVSVIDAENYIIAVPDGDGYVDQLEVSFDLTNYRITMQAEQTGSYLSFVDGCGMAAGYYIMTTVYYGLACVLEQSELHIRNIDTGAGYDFGWFNEVTFKYAFNYEVYGDLLVGDGSYGTNGVLWDWGMEFNPITSKSITMKKGINSNHIKIVEEVEFNGDKAYRVEFIK